MGTERVRRWLVSILILVGLMVAIGGVTRLTGSGLSITEWKPIMGAIPPLTETDWQIAFERYRQIPQYALVNSAMTIDAFKWIFFWEYLHRLFGRFIGFAFLIPMVVFWRRSEIPTRWKRPVLGVFALGGLQGAMGWFMVMSGLSERVSVSHFRLAAHLLLAFLIGVATLWILKSLGDEAFPERRSQRVFHGRLWAWVRFLVSALALQTLYGAFTAGLKAGYQYPTFPTFWGEWFPGALWLGSWPALMNPVAVQWIHRLLGSILVASVLGIGIYAYRYCLRCKDTRKELALSQRRALWIFGALVCAQYGVGISVVLWGVPVWLGTLHQGIGYLLALAATQLVFEFGRRRQ